MAQSLSADKASDLADARIETAIIQNGSYSDYVAHSVDAHGAEPLFAMGLSLFETLPLILIGMALYRFGMFGDGIAQAKLRKWGWIGVTTGIAMMVRSDCGTLPMACPITVRWRRSWGLEICRVCR